jgi:hypothetical protein
MRWIFLFLALNCTAQPDRFWHGGGNYRLDFISNPPTVLSGGCLNTTEGTACISDPSGVFLFATDGVTVYDRNCSVMTNGSGLLGGSSSTQSAIIVQKPGSSSVYYVFTASQDVNPPGICYSEVDMTLAGGFGAVTVKNVNLTAFTMCEKLTAVRHCNNTDVWVIGKRWNSSAFLAWRITPGGVITAPVTSPSGVSPSGITQSSYGQLKANSQGNRLVAAYYGTTTGGMNTAEIYNFDNSTGVVSGAINLGVIAGAYGCEFSPNGNVVYVSTNGGNLFSYNLCAANIPATRFQVASTGPFFGSIQADKYGKLLVAKGTFARLAAVQSPDVFGAGCNFTDNYRALSSTSRMGLPNFVPYYFQQTLQFIWNEICGTVTFQVPNSQVQCGSLAGPVGYLWEFGDGNFSNLQNPVHAYSSPGNYNVSLTTIFPCYQTVRNETITVTDGALLLPISHD